MLIIVNHFPFLCFFLQPCGTVAAAAAARDEAAAAGSAAAAASVTGSAASGAAAPPESAWRFSSGVRIGGAGASRDFLPLPVQVRNHFEMNSSLDNFFQRAIFSLGLITSNQYYSIRFKTIVPHDFLRCNERIFRRHRFHVDRWKRRRTATCGQC